MTAELNEKIQYLGDVLLKSIDGKLIQVGEKLAKIEAEKSKEMKKNKWMDYLVRLFVR